MAYDEVYKKLTANGQKSIVIDYWFPPHQKHLIPAWHFIGFITYCWTFGDLGKNLHCFSVDRWQHKFPHILFCFLCGQCMMKPVKQFNLTEKNARTATLKKLESQPRACLTILPQYPRCQHKKIQTVISCHTYSQWWKFMALNNDYPASASGAIALNVSQSAAWSSPTAITSPSWNRPSSKASASGFCTLFWITRCNGRAPNWGS